MAKKRPNETCCSFLTKNKIDICMRGRARECLFVCRGKATKIIWLIFLQKKKTCDWRNALHVWNATKTRQMFCSCLALITGFVWSVPQRFPIVPSVSAPSNKRFEHTWCDCHLPPTCRGVPVSRKAICLHRNSTHRCQKFFCFLDLKNNKISLKLPNNLISSNIWIIQSPQQRNWVMLGCYGRFIKIHVRCIQYQAGVTMTKLFSNALSSCGDIF